jgi:hypothetical protein
MQLNLLMDDCHFSNSAKIKYFFSFNHIGENKKLVILQNHGHILSNENNIVKELMNVLLNSN